MDVIARTSGPSAKRDIARSSRVSVGSFQRSLCETLYTSEVTLRSVRVGWVGGISFRLSLRCRAWSGVHLRDLLRLLESSAAL